MSLILAGLVFAGTSGALFLGRILARRRADAEPAPPDEPAKPSEAPESKADDEAPKRAPPRPPPPGGAANRVEGFVCQLGDVVMRMTGEEAWLAGGVVLSEEVPVAILFVAPEAGHDRMIYARTRPKGNILWLEPLDPGAIFVSGQPPSSVEHEGIRFDRARRLPLRPRRIGVGAPNLGDAVVVAEYTSPGAERILTLKANSGAAFCYRGIELEEGMFEVIPSGDATLP